MPNARFFGSRSPIICSNDGSIAATRDRWTTSIRRSRTERTGGRRSRCAPQVDRSGFGVPWIFAVGIARRWREYQSAEAETWLSVSSTLGRHSRRMVKTSDTSVKRDACCLFLRHAWLAQWTERLGPNGRVVSNRMMRVQLPHAAPIADPPARNLAFEAEQLGSTPRSAATLGLVG